MANSLRVHVLCELMRRYMYALYALYSYLYCLSYYNIIDFTTNLKPRIRYQYNNVLNSIFLI